MLQAAEGCADPQHVSDHWRVRRPPAWITSGRVVLSSASRDHSVTPKVVHQSSSAPAAVHVKVVE
eukprot:9240457-Karenia_brevis.AAC.1